MKQVYILPILTRIGKAADIILHSAGGPVPDEVYDFFQSDDFADILSICEGGAVISGKSVTDAVSDKITRLESDLHSSQLEIECLQNRSGDSSQHEIGLYEDNKGLERHIMKLEQENRTLREWQLRAEEELGLLRENSKMVTKLHERIRELGGMG